jgi:putative membrane protein
LFRTERHIPLARVQSVVQRRNLLHRLFGVTELRLESSGGTRPEAVMNVIRAAEAERLERVLRSVAYAAPATAADAMTAVPAAQEPRAETETLFALGSGELLRLGLISSRGWIVVGMAIGLWWQLAPSDHSFSRLLTQWGRAAFQLWLGNPDQALRALGLSVLSLVAFLLLLKPLSVLMTAMLYHGFRLTRDGGRLSTACGLLTARSASARSERIQRFVQAAPPLARLLRRATLCCDVAVQRQEQEGGELMRLHWLAPIGAPQRLDSVVRELAPALLLERRIWRPLHQNAWLRVWKHWWWLAVIAGVLLCQPLRHWTWVPMLTIVVWGFFAARGWARFAAYAHDDGVLAWRAGWLGRQWTTAFVRDGHVARLAESPFDRRAGMASVQLDTAGAASSLFPLRIPYLPAAEARALHAALTAGIAAPQR